MKKLIGSILVALTLVLSVIGLTACDLVNFNWGTGNDHEHHFTEYEAHDPTCATPGNKRYFKCDVGSDACGKIYEDLAAMTPVPESEVIIPALGHKYDLEHIVWSAWNGKQITATVTCTQCDENEPGHVLHPEITLKGEKSKDPTCTAKGETTYTASFTYEGKTYTCPTTTTVADIESTPHVYGQPKWTWTPDHKATATFTCQNQDDKTSQPVVMEAKVTDAVTKAPTCTAKGETTYTATVQFNGETYTSTTTADIEMTPHTYQAPTWSWNDDYSQATATFKCKDCTEQQTVTVTATESANGKIEKSEEEIPGECQNGTKTTYTATVNFNGKEYKTDPVEVVTKEPVKQHTAGAWQHDATQHWHKCSVCGKDMDDKTDHSFKDGHTCECGFVEESITVTAISLSAAEGKVVLTVNGTCTGYADLAALKAAFGTFGFSGATSGWKYPAYDDAEKFNLTLTDKAWTITVEVSFLASDTYNVCWKNDGYGDIKLTGTGSAELDNKTYTFSNDQWGNLTLVIADKVVVNKTFTVTTLTLAANAENTAAILTISGTYTGYDKDGLTKLFCEKNEAGNYFFYFWGTGVNTENAKSVTLTEWEDGEFSVELDVTDLGLCNKLRNILRVDVGDWNKGDIVVDETPITVGGKVYTLNSVNGHGHLGLSVVDKAAAQKTFTVTGAQIATEGGKAVVTLSGTYAGYTKDEFTAAISDDNENEVGFRIINAGPVDWSKAAGPTSYEVGEGTFSVTFDVTDLAAKSYYVNRQEGSDTDIKSLTEKYENSVTVGTKTYKLVGTPTVGENEGNVALFITDTQPTNTFALAAVTLEADATAVYVVYSGTHDYADTAELKAKFEAESFEIYLTGNPFPAASRTVTVAANTWTIKAKVPSDLAYNTYYIYFNGGAKDSKGDVRLKDEQAKDGESVELAGNKYSIVNKGNGENTGKDDGTYWGCVCLRIEASAPAPKYAPTNATLKAENGKVYFVYSGTYANYDREGFEKVVAENGFLDLVKMRDNTYTHGHTQENFRKELTVFAEGKWEVQIEITLGSLGDFFATGVDFHFDNTNTNHLSNLDEIWDPTGSVTEGGYVYSFFKDGRTWNNISFIIEKAIPYTDVTLENTDSAVYLVYRGTYKGYTEQEVEAFLNVTEGTTLPYSFAFWCGNFFPANIAEVKATASGEKEGTWEVKIDITDFGTATYSVLDRNMGGGDAKGPAGFTAKTLEVSWLSATYKLTGAPNAALQLEVQKSLELPENEITFGGEPIAKANPDHMFYWNGNESENANVTANTFADGTYTFEYAMKGESMEWFGVQLFYKNSKNVVGTSYKLSFKLNSSVAGKITINHNVVDLTSGENTISIIYTESADASLSIQFGVETEKTVISGGKFIITELKFEENKEVQKNAWGYHNGGFADGRLNFYFWQSGYSLEEVQAAKLVIGDKELALNNPQNYSEENLADVHIAYFVLTDVTATGNFQLKLKIADDVYDLPASAVGTENIDKAYSNETLTYTLRNSNDMLFIEITAKGTQPVDPQPSESVEVTLEFVEAYDANHFHFNATSSVSIATGDYDYVTVNGTQLWSEGTSNGGDKYTFKVYVDSQSLASYEFKWMKGGKEIAHATYTPAGGGTEPQPTEKKLGFAGSVLQYVDQKLRLVINIDKFEGYTSDEYNTKDKFAIEINGTTYNCGEIGGGNVDHYFWLTDIDLAAGSYTVTLKFDGKTYDCPANNGEGSQEFNGKTYALAIVDGKLTLTVTEQEKEEPSATLSFESKILNRTEYSTKKQVWEQDGITLTNEGSMGDYDNPVRLYKNSTVKIEYPNAITKIVFHCGSTDYSSALQNSLAEVAGITVTVDGLDVTVTLETAATSFEFTASAQIRLNSITVYVTELFQPTDEDKVADAKGALLRFPSAVMFTVGEEVEFPTTLKGAAVTYELQGTTDLVRLDVNKLVVLKLPEADAEITLKATLTVGEKSDNADLKVTIKAKDALGTSEKPITVAEAIAFAELIGGNGYLGGAENPAEVYVTGFVIQVGGWESGRSDWTKVYIADTNDTGAKEKVQVYRLGLDDTYLKEEADLVVGSQITIFGCLQSYNGNAEVSHNPKTDANCKAVAYIKAEPEPEMTDTWLLVEDVRSLKAGAQILLVYIDKDHNFVNGGLSDDNKYLKALSGVSVEGNKITKLPKDAQPLTLGKEGENWTLSINETLLGLTKVDNNSFATSGSITSTWTISIEDGVAKIASTLASGSNTCRLQCNTADTQERFSNYKTSTQKDPSIYMLQDAE